MLQPVYYGSVNRWECDENDHLNVRFFAQKMQQTLQYGLVELGLAKPEQISNMMRSIHCQHMRYHAEARIAVPMSGHIGLVEYQGETRLLTELRNTSSSALLSTYLFELPNLPSQGTMPCPEYAGQRGIESPTFNYKSETIDSLQSRGLATIGQGVIQPEECDADGYLQNFLYVGRVSDSMPNLFARFEDSDRGDGVTGGAVLEYRMTRFSQLKAGDRFILLSGVESLQEKTQQFVHIMFNADTGEMVSGSEAVAISMDLVARKAIAIPAERRAKMQSLLIRDSA